MKTPPTEQALKIRNARKKAGMTQKELGIATGKTTGMYIQQVESGTRVPTLKSLTKIANACGVCVADLLPHETFVPAHEKGLTPNEYQCLAMRTSNKSLSPDNHLLNGVLGLCGEAGEVADLVKKNQMQGHDLDLQHIAKELGDICWYIAETATAIGYDLEHIMQMNIDKLKARYPEGFDAERSLHRQTGDI